MKLEEIRDLVAKAREAVFDGERDVAACRLDAIFVALSAHISALARDPNELPKTPDAIWFVRFVDEHGAHWSPSTSHPDAILVEQDAIAAAARIRDRFGVEAEPVQVK